MLEVWRRLRGRMRMVHAFTRPGSAARRNAFADGADPKGSDNVADLHRAYVAVLRQGDVAAAVEATRDHLRFGREFARESYGEIGANRTEE